jgi:hypothetical protein
MNKTTYKKIRPILIFCLILMFIACISNGIYYSINEDLIYEKELGKKVVLNKDTLVVIDYSSGRKTLKLSNGIEIQLVVYKKLGNYILIHPK